MFEKWWRWRENPKAAAEPFPAKLAWLLENPLSRMLTRSVVRHLELGPGMRVLDVGAGPGRVALPVARRVGSEGEVVALDVQPEMTDRLERRAREAGLSNIRTVVGGAGEDRIEERDHFDRAALVTVLGEIPAERREAALAEINHSLKPGGLLVVDEGFSDPHYKSPETVRALAEQTGFTVRTLRRKPLGYTMVLAKDLQV